MEIFKENPKDNEDEYQYERPGADVSDSDISHEVSKSEEAEEDGKLADEILLQEERKKDRKNKNGVYKDPLLARSKPKTKTRKSKKHKKNVKKIYRLRKSTAEQTETYKNIKVSDFSKKVEQA
ncbi:hypothetical protein MHBO_002713 [Bonamia ostreae]